MNLLVVESPAKAKTINKYLGNDFEVIATVGHFRDLAKKDGVKVTEDYSDVELNWETTTAGMKMLDSIEKKAEGYEKIYLATDPDREGEAITWHLVKSLEKKIDKNKFERITFNEITKNAVINSFKESRKVDDSLVSAYLARRSLDYLAGYSLSPVLWRKMPGSRSAGRVQSVAVRLIYEKEIEIEQFEPEKFYKINVYGEINGAKLDTSITSLDGQKVDKLFFKNEALAEKAKNYLNNNKFFSFPLRMRKQLADGKATSFPDIYVFCVPGLWHSPLLRQRRTGRWEGRGEGRASIFIKCGLLVQSDEVCCREAYG